MQCTAGILCGGALHELQATGKNNVDFKKSNTPLWGHELSEFYEGRLEKGGFSKFNLRKVRRRAGGGGGTNIEGLRRGLKGGLRRGASQGGLEGGLEKGLEGGA